MKPGTEPDFLLLQKIKNGKSRKVETGNCQRHRIGM